MNEDAFSCACYLDQQGNRPAKGDVLSWAESSAVVYANSVLGARCNRNSGIMDLMGSVAGYVPLLRPAHRRGPQGQLGHPGGKPPKNPKPSCWLRHRHEGHGRCALRHGLDKWLGNDLDDAACAYLKDFGAATASNGAVGLYHIDGLTPEAREQGTDLILPDAKEYVIDDAELQRVKDNYPLVWKNPDATPKLCFVGCPHLSLQQLKDWTERWKRP